MADGSDEDQPIIYFRPPERDRIAQEALRRSPQLCHATIEKADRFCAGGADIFGNPVDVSGEIPWHTDCVSGRTWPTIPAPRIPIVYSNDKSDIKAPWELARFQFLGDLGRAWAYTHDDKYAQKGREAIESFLSHNPPGMGIHWISPMEAAIRAANWIVADSFFTGGKEWNDDFRHRLRASLYDHGRFIRRHLERDGRGINNNHYTANLAGLFIIGLYFDRIDSCRAWRAFALNELDREIDVQIGPDGMHYENSFGYHRLTCEMLFYTFRLGILNCVPQVERWKQKLADMAEFTLAVTMPNGRVPNFGDNDDGVWLSGSRRLADDHRYLVFLSAAAFGRPDPSQIKPAVEEIPEEIFWYVGADAARDVPRTLESSVGRNPRFAEGKLGFDNCLSFSGTTRCDGATSRVFERSGIVLMRSSNGYVLVSANPVGTGGIGGHKHNDLLSYVLVVDEQEIVVDPGTYAYTAEPPLRNHLRSTAAHNTVMVDHAEQNRFVSRQLFWVRNDARPEIASWETGDTRDRLVVRHDGYRRLPGHVTHTRSFIFDKTADLLVIGDELSGTGEHEIMSVTNFGEGTLNIDDPRRVTLTAGDGNRLAAFLFETGRPWRPSIELAWRSTSYRQKKPMFRMVQRCRARLPITWTTVISVCDRAPVEWEFMEQHRASCPCTTLVPHVRQVTRPRSAGPQHLTEQEAVSHRSSCEIHHGD